MIGQTISHYKVVQKLGEGGMGVVYKAEDLKLGRAVALKFLPSHLIESDEHKARFLHEARAAALLDHPNICTVYEIDEADGRTFLAMACLEGETLKHKIAARPLPLKEALDIAIQIGQGLQAAHEKGIVHRDIKPANIMITPQGQVKIMDFGLAQLSDRTKLTASGMKLGTPAYMSPEQTEGKPADGRSDIWALGVVLYEMISGHVPFPGETEAAVAHAILRTEPEPLTAVRSGVPIELDHILAKTLAKEPSERYQHIDDLLVDLRKCDAPRTSRAGQPTDQPDKETRSTVAGGSTLGKPVSRFTALAMAALAAATTGFVVWIFTPQPHVLHSRHLALNLPAGQVLHEVGVPFAISRDGTKLAYVGGSFELSNLYLKFLDSGDVTVIPGTWPAIGAVFSHDDKWIAFKSNGVLKKVPVGGGAVVSLCDTGEATQENGMSWTPEGIFFSAGVSGNRGIVRVSAEGGTPEPVTTVQAGEAGHLRPQALPGGRAVLFTILTSRQPLIAQAAIQLLASGERKIVLENASAARYVASGHLVYARGSHVYAVGFDLHRLETVGSPVQLIEGVGSRGGTPQFAVADDGTFVYDSVVANARLGLVWVDREGETTPLATPARAYQFPTLSPDGQRLAVLSSEGARRDIWIGRLGGELNRFTYDGTATNAIWTPDGTALTFNGRDGERGVMFRQGVQAGSLSSRLFTTTGRSRGPWPGSWAPDGSALIFMQDSEGPTRGDLFSFLPGANGRTQPYLQTEFIEWGGRISPNGRWMAYVSNDSGRFEVYVRPYPGAGNRVQVSIDGGTEVAWARNGRELFYWNQQKLIAAQIQTEPVLELGNRAVLFEGPFVRSVPGIPNYDVSPDGTRFLMLKPSEETGEERSLNIIVNWFEELERRVPVAQ
jgi:serine/threonine-protein kinase